MLASGVSRHHAEFRADGPLWLVCDAGSTNGTFLGRHRVAQGLLTPGAVIRMGEAVGVVVSGPAARLAPAFGRLADGLYGGAAFGERLGDAKRVASSNLCVVLQGETGSGKERAAMALHAWSGRAGPLIAVNCAALLDGLVESELFGYRRGAFTGADQNHTGYLRSAHGGTLFLDEVTELSPSSQAKLLRALETREVVPLGETRPVPIDVRVISATQQPLESRVADGRFRADLMARLSEFRLELPPLRERREDVPGLFGAFSGRRLRRGRSAARGQGRGSAVCSRLAAQRARAPQRGAAHGGAAQPPPADPARAPAARARRATRRRDRGGFAAGSRELGRARHRGARAARRRTAALGRTARPRRDRNRIPRQRAQRLLQRFPERDPRRQG